MKHSDGSDETIERASFYVLGALPADEAQDFASHLETGCVICAAEVVPARVVVSALGIAGPPSDPPARVREDLLGQLALRTTAPLSFTFDSFVTVRADEGQWHQVFEGVTVKRLFADKEKGTVTSLYKVRPGARIPTHTHEGFEQCLIVEGDFHLNDQTFGPGDFTCAMAGSVRQISYSERGALLLIVAGTGNNVSHRPAA